MMVYPGTHHFFCLYVFNLNFYTLRLDTRFHLRRDLTIAIKH